VNYISNILKLKEQNRNLNKENDVLTKNKEDIKTKIDDFDAMDDAKKEIDFLKFSLKELYRLNAQLILLSALSVSFFLILAFSTILDSFIHSLIIYLLPIGILGVSIRVILNTIAQIKKCNLDIKAKNENFKNLLEKVKNYGKTKEELISIFNNLEIKTIENQKKINSNDLKIEQSKQGIINHYAKDNINFKVLKSASKIKKLSK